MAKLCYYAVFQHNSHDQVRNNVAYNVAKEHSKDVDELRSRILAWDELDQRVIDTAVRQGRTRLRACVKAKGGHFEHKLSQ